MSSGFFTDDKKRVRPLTPSIASFFGSSVVDEENAARRALLRRQEQARRQAGISRSGVDSSGLKGTLNSYIEASRVKALDAFAEEKPRQTLAEMKTLDVKGENKGLAYKQLADMGVKKLAEQVLLQKYVAENTEGWRAALYMLKGKIGEMTDEELVALAGERVADEYPSTNSMVLDHFLASEAHRRRKTVYGSYGSPLRGGKRDRKLTQTDKDLEAAAMTLRSRINDYVRSQDSGFVNDVTIRREKPQKPHFKKISIIAGNEQYLDQGRPAPF